MAWIKLNATTPAAPTGARNVHFRKEAGHAGTQTDPDPVSAFLDGRASAGITIDGGGSVPATGSKGYVQIPFACTIKSWTLLGNVSGSAQVTVKRSTYAGFPTTASIVAAAPPILSTAQKNTSSTLTGWTTAIAAGDILEFVLDSISTISRLHLFLELVKT